LKGSCPWCRTGRFEAHIWQEGKQIYLGGFDAEEQAALAYDLAALKFRGIDAQTNYDKSTYEQEMLQFNEVSGHPSGLPIQDHCSDTDSMLGSAFCAPCRSVNVHALHIMMRHCQSMACNSAKCHVSKQTCSSCGQGS
jgi:hypothetical protein